MLDDWRAAVWAAHKAGSLTRASRDVLLTLATFRGPGGRIWPAHARLAERVRCSVKTVGRALEAARSLGLVSWQAIRWRAATGAWRRKSNLYRLAVPPIGHFGREGEKPERKQLRGRSVAQQIAALGVPSDVAAARAALAEVAERRARVLWGQDRHARQQV